MMPHLDLSVFSERSNVFALIDSDPKSRKNRDKFRDNCNKYRIPCYKLERYAIENYFTLEAIRRVFPEVPETISKIEPHKKVEKQLGINIKKNNINIIKFMSLENIIHTDLYNFCMEFKEHLETNSSIKI